MYSQSVACFGHPKKKKKPQNPFPNMEYIYPYRIGEIILYISMTPDTKLAHFISETLHAEMRLDFLTPEVSPSYREEEGLCNQPQIRSNKF